MKTLFVLLIMFSGTPASNVQVTFSESAADCARMAKTSESFFGGKTKAICYPVEQIDLNALKYWMEKTP